MPYALATREDWLLAGLADGRIFASSNKGESWELLDIHGPSLRGLKAFASPAFG
jgi:hypothetical protein